MMANDQPVSAYNENAPLLEVKTDTPVIPLVSEKAGGQKHKCRKHECFNKKSDEYRWLKFAVVAVALGWAALSAYEHLNVAHLQVFSDNSEAVLDVFSYPGIARVDVHESWWYGVTKALPNLHSQNYALTWDLKVYPSEHVSVSFMAQEPLSLGVLDMGVGVLSTATHSPMQVDLVLSQQEVDQAVLMNACTSNQQLSGSITFRLHAVHQHHYQCMGWRTLDELTVPIILRCDTVQRQYSTYMASLPKCGCTKSGREYGPPCAVPQFHCGTPDHPPLMTEPQPISEQSSEYAYAAGSDPAFPQEVYAKPLMVNGEESEGEGRDREDNGMNEPGIQPR